MWSLRFVFEYTLFRLRMSLKRLHNFTWKTTSKNSHRFISRTKPIDRHLRKRANSSERNETQIVFHTRKTHEHTKSNWVLYIRTRRLAYMWLRQNFTSNKQSLCAINRFTPGNNYFEQYLHYVHICERGKRRWVPLGALQQPRKALQTSLPGPGLAGASPSPQSSDRELSCLATITVALYCDRNSDKIAIKRMGIGLLLFRSMVFDNLIVFR